MIQGDSSMDKKYQVFVSSTYEDLQEERLAVIQCLLDNDCIPVGMEQFHGVPMNQWDYITKLLDNSDYCVLILAGKYGSIEKSSGISYTEKEFDYAIAHEIPVIRLLVKDIEGLTTKKSENDSGKKKKLSSFRKKVTEDILADFYENLSDLKIKLVTSIHKAIKECPREGWVRATEVKKLQETVRCLQDEKKNLITNINRKPELELVLSNNSFVKPEYEHNFIGKIDYTPISNDDVPDEYRKYISKEDIEKFNKNLPSEKAVRIYNRQMFLYCANEYKNYCNFDLVVDNNGNVPATDVRISFEVPDGVVILRKWTLNSKECPKNILPENPLRRARRLYQQDKLNANLTYALQENFLNLCSRSVLRGNLLHKNLFKEIDPQILNKRSWRIYDSNNIIDIGIDKIQQKREFDLSKELVILPLKTGKFEMNVQIICDEYEDFDKQTLTFDVTDKVS